MTQRLHRKPTRQDFLRIITELQDLIGKAQARHANDRDRDGFEKGQAYLQEAHELCIEARGYDAPTAGLPPVNPVQKK